MMDNAQAQFEAKESRRDACIEILNPSDYPQDCWFPQDMERELVHELLHLVLLQMQNTLYREPLKDETPEDTVVEQTINQLADAVIALKRREWRWTH